MISDSLFTLFFIAIAAFIGWRLWRSIFDQKADVRGGVYARSDDPARYWITIFFMTAGALMTSAIALLFAGGLLGWIG